MTTEATIAETRGAHASDTLLGVVAQYRRRLRRRLVRFAEGHPARADLLVTFPAAAVTLAVGAPSHHEAQRIARLVDEGVGLKALAEALGLPGWARRLPARAITGAMAGPASSRLWTPQFNAEVANYVPEDPDEAAIFLRWLRELAEIADQEFALWIIKQRLPWRRFENRGTGIIVPLAFYAFISRDEGAPAHALLGKAWHPKMRLPAAVGHAYQWLLDLQMDVELAGSGPQTTWLAGGRVGGYRFVPLLTRDALQEEGKAMNHCVADYTQAVARGEVRIFSVRTQCKRRVATLEILPHYAGEGVPQIGQFYGPENAVVPHEVWRAAYLWLARQTAYNVPTCGCATMSAENVERWERLTREFRRARGHMPVVKELLTTRPERGTFQALRDMVQAWQV